MAAQAEADPFGGLSLREYQEQVLLPKRRQIEQEVENEFARRNIARELNAEYTERLATNKALTNLLSNLNLSNTSKKSGKAGPAKPSSLRQRPHRNLAGIGVVPKGHEVGQPVGSLGKIKKDRKTRRRRSSRKTRQRRA